MPYSIERSEIKTVKTDDYAEVIVNNNEAIQFRVGVNVISIKVNSQDNSNSQTYIMAITRSNIVNISSTIGNLLHVPAGSFQRDSNYENISKITKAYCLSEHQITREQFKNIMLTDPSNKVNSSGEDDPVQQVSWYQAIAFCNKLSLRENLEPAYKVNGVNFSELTYEDIPKYSVSDWDTAFCNLNASGYRLPTEMEWMWAAMGAPDNGQDGGVNRKDYSKNFAGSDGRNNLDDVAWYFKNSNSSTHPVGSKDANELGLYDMSGNVWEWCADWYAEYPAGRIIDYAGPETGRQRIRRGGAYSLDPYNYAVAYRSQYLPASQNRGIGFRVLCPIM